jgi:hypothetical protein
MRIACLILLIAVLAGWAGCSQSPESGPGPATAAESASPSKPADEQGALAALAEINNAQSDYFTRSRRYAITYDELIETLFLKAEPSADAIGYDIRLRPAADASRYTVIATPLASSPTVRHFLTDQTGVIRAEQGKDATVDSPAVTN